MEVIGRNIAKFDNYFVPSHDKNVYMYLEGDIKQMQVWEVMHELINNNETISVAGSLSVGRDGGGGEGIGGCKQCPAHPTPNTLW